MLRSRDPYPKYVQSLADKIEELENRFGNRYVNTSCTVVCFCNDAVLIQISWHHSRAD